MILLVCACGLDLETGKLASAESTVAAVNSTTNASMVVQADQRARTAELKGDITAWTQALNDEANAQLRSHDYNDGEKILLQVLQLQEAHAGPNSLGVANALLNLGWFYANLARYDAAQEALDRCREIRERLLGSEAASVAEVLNALGSLEENRGNLPLAEAFYRQAVAIQEKTLGLQSPVTANTWNNLATLYWITGDYASAQKLFAQALAVREKAFGAESVIVAKTLNNLALLDVSLGDYDEAEDYFQRTLKIRSARLGPDHPATLTVLGQLGLLYVREGNDARAEPLLAEVVAKEQKIGEDEGPDLARDLAELASLDDRRKQYASAEPLLLRALDIRRRLLGEEHPEYAESLAALARHDHRQGRLSEAEPLYEQALKIDQDVLGDNHPETLAVATDLAFLKIELRQPDDATRLAGNVAATQQNIMNGVFTFAAEHQRMGFERTIEPCDLPAALADPDLLAQMVLRTKGVVLDSLLEDAQVGRAEQIPEVREMIERRRLLLAQLGQATGESAEADSGPTPMTPDARAKLEHEEQQVEAELAEKGVSSGKIRRALETDVSDVRDALPADTALIEYVVYNRYVGKLEFLPAYGAVVLTREGPAQWVPLGSAADIEARVRLDQKYMRQRVRDTTLTTVLRGLDETLCEPVVAALPPGIHRLIISPDGELNFISFATLLDDNDRFLADDFDVRYVASGRDLLRGPHVVPPKRVLVVFADPDYDDPPALQPVRHRARVSANLDDVLVPLPGTLREAGFLQQEARSDGLDSMIFRGVEASKANLTAQDSPFILHLATHGLYLSPDEFPRVPAGSGDTTPASLGQPMVRSLLALAGGAQTLRAWKKGVFPASDDDGLLTAQQAAGLHLNGTWLVILSACDTGDGEVSVGEGVLGLRRGFAEAGAQNLLLTLWTADDVETSNLMEAFYHDALQSGDAPGALARVQRAKLDELRATAGLSDAVRKAGPFILSY